VKPLTVCESVEQKPGSVEQKPDRVEQKPGSVEQKPGAFRYLRSLRDLRLGPWWAQPGPAAQQNIQKLAVAKNSRHVVFAGRSRREAAPGVPGKKSSSWAILEQMPGFGSAARPAGPALPPFLLAATGLPPRSAKRMRATRGPAAGGEGSKAHRARARCRQSRALSRRDLNT
jgi:hypothetical protein